jgi:cytidylate kinase
MMENGPELRPPRPKGPRIVIVGPCASGKTTLAEALISRGLDAAVCGQEHSEIRTLWNHTRPDVVIGLTVTLQALRERRGADWPASLYRRQLGRLAPAYSVADLVIDTTSTDPDAAVDAVLTHLAR